MNDTTVTETKELSNPKLTWTDRTEELLISWCDVGRCFSWLHEKSFRKFTKNHYFFSIPIIVLSTITGTASVAMTGYVPETYITYAQLAVGGVNIFTGILSTLQNFFRSAQSSESHYNANVGWEKLCRNIEIELSLERNRRKNANDFVKICRAEYDRLLEQSPIVPMDIIKRFKKELHLNPELILPMIVGGVSHARAFKGFAENFTPRRNMDVSRKGVLDQVKTAIENVKISKDNIPVSINIDKEEDEKAQEPIRFVIS